MDHAMLLPATAYSPLTPAPPPMHTHAPSIDVFAINQHPSSGQQQDDLSNLGKVIQQVTWAGGGDEEGWRGNNGLEE